MAHALRGFTANALRQSVPSFLRIEPLALRRAGFVCGSLQVRASCVVVLIACEPAERYQPSIDVPAIADQTDMVRKDLMPDPAEAA